jgi:phosphoribosylglycinamide formyltransferase-1
MFFEEKIMHKLAVLVSGTGSLLEAMLEAGLTVTVVVADRPCRALTIAESYGVPHVLVERTDFTKKFDRVAYTDRVLDVLREHKISFIAMAGFMTVFSQAIFDEYSFRILNTHPSLLPAFKGDKAVADAIAYGVKISGCTIHIATIKLDAGPILAQEPVKVFSWDTKETLHERIKEVERGLYPALLKAMLQNE